MSLCPDTAEEIISQAGEWCLGHIEGRAPDFEIRAARASDYEDLTAMELRAFPNFSRRLDAWGRGFYDARKSMETEFGTILRVVAFFRGRLNGYAILQHRNWCEVYGHELAICPDDPSDQNATTGPLLVGVAAKIACILGAATLSANVQPNKADPKAQRRLLTYYARFGLRPAYQPGILFEGVLADTGDVWLTQEPEAVLRNFVDRFERAR